MDWDPPEFPLNPDLPRSFRNPVQQQFRPPRPYHSPPPHRAARQTRPGHGRSEVGRRFEGQPMGMMSVCRAGVALSVCSNRRRRCGTALSPGDSRRYEGLSRVGIPHSGLVLLLLTADQLGTLVPGGAQSGGPPPTRSARQTPRRAGQARRPGGVCGSTRGCRAAAGNGVLPRPNAGRAPLLWLPRGVRCSRGFFVGGTRRHGEPGG